MIIESIKDMQENLYNSCNLHIRNLTFEKNSDLYFSCFFYLENKKILFKIAKKTPKKFGWFVTLWKRVEGLSLPYDKVDDVEFVVVCITENDQVGQFIFSKEVLLQKNIFSTNNKGGKRAIRVYAPFTEVLSNQACETKKWQSKYFIDLKCFDLQNINKLKNLYSIN